MSLIKPIIKRLNSGEEEEIESDDIIKAVKDEISRKVSIDSRRLSLNALELLTRENGLEHALGDIVREAYEQVKAKKASKLKDVIMQELIEVQKMLDARNKAIT